MSNELIKSSGLKPRIITISLIILGILLVVALLAGLIRKNRLETSEEIVASSSEINSSSSTTTSPTIRNNRVVDQVIPDGAKVEVVGANPILNGVVVTETGAPAQNSAVPMSPEAPKQSAPIKLEDLPATAIKLEISDNTFKPASFQVRPGAPVTLSLTSSDRKHHVLIFDNPVLSAVAISSLPGQTKAITFNAPTEKGEYTFHCDLPFHSDNGETGVMIVR